MIKTPYLGVFQTGDRPFNEWLKTAHSGKKGVRKRFTNEMVILYGLERDTDVKMLDKALKVYLAREREKESTKDRKTNIEIENELGLMKRKDEEPFSYSQTQTISDYYRIADKVMKSVAKGKFPVTK